MLLLPSKKELGDQPPLPSTFSIELKSWYLQLAIDLKDVHLSRRAMIEELRCGNFTAAKRLSRALRDYDMDTLPKLYSLGLHGLLRIDGLGERAAWVATCLLDARGYDVYVWFQGDTTLPARSRRGAIRTAVAKVRKSKRR